jgi:hypothetical protein
VDHLYATWGEALGALFVSLAGWRSCFVVFCDISAVAPLEAIASASCAAAAVTWSGLPVGTVLIPVGLCAAEAFKLVCFRLRAV